MFADLGPTWGPIVAGAMILVGIGCLVFLIVRGYRCFAAAADRARMRAFQGSAVSETPGPGLVEVVFHTYSGLVAFVDQVEHHFWAKPDDARVVLSRFNRFNLTWGFFAYGALFIPVLSLANYWVQRVRISKQASRLGRPPCEP